MDKVFFHIGLPNHRYWLKKILDTPKRRNCPVQVILQGLSLKSESKIFASQLGQNWALSYFSKAWILLRPLLREYLALN